MVDANGLDERNRSSSRDLLKLAELALAHPVIADIVSTQQITIPHLGQLENSNLLLHSVDTMQGIKTGTTSVAGACLLWAVQIEAFGEPYTMVGVSLGGSTQRALAPQVRALFESASDDFQQLTLTEAGESLIRYETPWGETIEAVTEDRLQLVTYGEATIDGQITADSVQLVSTGEQLGELRFEHHGTLYRTPLISNGTITGPDFWWRVWNPDQLW